ncbi:putative methylenetetrahydrofolate reductase (NAD(P)H) [Bacteriovorax sp. BAL6_X]|uniref:methylenetetrahydrofolate reductase n=1 Tax=Bacteriovorax sp. BAL6_X TaxID=1201290 RepID=UPI0003856B2B|nr:methylenetetrahydrofolate reductase [Bacteriovorax sp. BAL6_X]EPZ49918.1 putative methylenetetrahydrofolate reductase (NAD(P)H) [Bacteriovorax sp. BAL6_X]
MKVIEHIDKATNPLFSFEIVPPPRGKNISAVTDIVKQLLPFNPAWIDVTAHSAGAYYNEKNDGSVERKIYKKRPGTVGICGVIQNRFKIDTVTHLLTQGFTKEETEDALIELNYLGIHNVLALRGDALNYNKKYDLSRQRNFYAKDLVEQIDNVKKGIYLDEISNSLPLDFSVGVAGYPEKHFEAPNLATDIKYLKEKVDAGADYIVTQMFFDNSKYFEFVDKCREAGITCPIVPGIKVIKSMGQLSNVPRHFYVDFPDEFVNEATENPEHIKEIGIKWARKQTEELLNANVPSVHFYVMNDSANVTEVLKGLF